MGQYTILSSSIKYTGGVFNCATVYEARKEAYKKLKQVIKRRKNLTDKDLVNLKFKMTKLTKMKGGNLNYKYIECKKTAEEVIEEENSSLTDNEKKALIYKICESYTPIEDIEDIENIQIDINFKNIKNKYDFYNTIKNKDDEGNIIYDYNIKNNYNDNINNILIAYLFYKYLYFDNKIYKTIDNIITEIKKHEKIKYFIENYHIKHDNYSIITLILAICNIIPKKKFSNIEEYKKKYKEEYKEKIKQYITNYDISKNPFYTDKEIEEKNNIKELDEESKKTDIENSKNDLIDYIKNEIFNKDISYKKEVPLTTENVATYYNDFNSYMYKQIDSIYNSINLNNLNYKPYLDNIKENRNAVIKDIIKDIIYEKKVDKKVVFGGSKKKPAKKSTSTKKHVSTKK